MQDQFTDQVSEVSGLVRALRKAVRALEPTSLTGTEAEELLRLFAEGERVLAAGRTIAARAVERSGAWRKDGHRTAAHWISSTTGVSVGQAVGTLETARRVEHLPPHHRG